MRYVLLLALAICTLMGVSQGVVKRSDDMNDIQTLQTLVQQQAAAISTLQATVNSQQAAFNTLQATVNSQHTSLNSLQSTVNSQVSAIYSLQASDNGQQVKITGLETKVQTLSKSVAFTAMFSHDDMIDGIPLGPQQTLLFDRIATNAGNGYNPTTGIFTAPLGGLYAFSIFAMEPHNSTHPSLKLSIIKNDAVVDQVWVENTLSANNEQASTQSVTHLAAGDQVWIRQEGSGDSVRGDYWTVFTGFLVHAD